MKDDRFSTIRYEIRKALKISVAEYCLCDMIYHLSSSKKAKVKGYACAKTSYYADKIGVTERAIRKMKKRMIDAGLISRHKSKSMALTTTEKWEECHIEGGTKFRPGRNKVPVKAEQSSGPSNKDNSKDNNKRGYTPEFEKFWDEYGLKVGKKTSFKKWNSLTEKDKKQIWDTLPAYLSETTADRNSKNKKRFRKDPATYLNQSVWEDYTARIEEVEQQDTEPTPFDDQYNAYLKHIKNHYPILASTVKYMSKAEYIDFLQKEYKMSAQIRRMVLRKCHDDIASGQVNHGTTVGQLYDERIKKKYREHQLV